MAKPIKVSVITITYNHEKYIRQALESIAKQDVNFNYEIIVADDASTDATPEIVRACADEFSQIVPVIRKYNIGAQSNFKDAILRAKGEYIALCEGDDFWNDATKLQRQVDFLEKNLDHAFCFHSVTVHFENDEKPDEIFPASSKKFTISQLLADNFIQTNSVLYRKQDYSGLPVDMLPLDWYLHLYHAQFGKIGFINRIMSTYRRHENGIWWNVGAGADIFWVKNGLPHLRVYEEILKLYGENESYVRIIHNSVRRIYDAILNLTPDAQVELLQRRAATEFPDLIIGAYVLTKAQLSKKEKVAATLEHEQKLLNEIIEIKNGEIHWLQNQLSDIQDSSSWKAAKKIQDVTNKLRRK